jgi:hypothetical protein
MDLQQILTAEADVAAALEQALLVQRQHLIAGDIAALDTANRQLIQLQQQARQLAAQRDALGTEAPRPGGSFTAALKARLQRIQTLSLENQGLIQASIQWANSTVQLLQEAVQPATYGSKPPSLQTVEQRV